MALIEADRLRVWRAVMRWWSRQRATCSFNNVELKAAIDDVDDWVETNQSSFIAALPTAFANGSSAGQKAALLMFVVMKRYGHDLPAEEN